MTSLEQDITNILCRWQGEDHAGRRGPEEVAKEIVNRALSNGPAPVVRDSAGD